MSALAAFSASALNEALEEADVNVLKNKEPNICSLRFDITTRNEEGESITSRLGVDYATEGQISIDRQG